MKFEAFITGSRAYGAPRPDSDIDLCVLADREDIATLFAERDTGSDSVHYGKLNLLLFNADDEGERERFQKWREVNDELVSRCTVVTRDEAIAAFQAAGAADTNLKSQRPPAGGREE